MNLDDDIHNYYEHLVAEKLKLLNLDKKYDPDYLADLCCIILNQLPPRYIRFQVDMAFYLPQDERIDMEQKVDKAIKHAVEFLDTKTQRDES